jgi:flagellar L-ring protein precursor FlgH
MRRHAALVAALLLLMTGCRQPAAVRAPTPVRLEIPEPKVSEGSLWQSDTGPQGLVADRIARRKGDLLTVLVVEDTNAKRDRKTSTSRAQDMNAQVDQLFFKKWNYKGELPVFKASSARNFAGSGSIEDTGTVRATLSAQVTETLPNGNLVVLGQKEVIVAGESQVVTLTGIVRPEDILPNNTVLSTQIAEARINIIGSGPLNDAQRRTLVGRLLDWINLF